MIAYALLGGPKDCWPAKIKEIFQNAKKNKDLVIGVDRGSLLLLEMGILPDLAIGDFDSLRLSERTKIENEVADIRYSNPVKDFTDTELMLRVALNDYHVEQLKILGATGGRLDHFLANLWMIFAPAVHSAAEKVTLIDKQNRVQFYLPGEHLIKAKKGYAYFGVAVLDKVRNLRIAGARYNLANYSVSYPRMFASNEFLPHQNTFQLSFVQGMVAVIFSKDIDRFYNVQEKKS